MRTLMAWIAVAMLKFGAWGVAMAAEYPQTSPPVYREFVYPPTAVVTELPWACRYAWPWQRCERDSDLELALEKEYWSYVQTSDVSGMQTWLARALGYAEKSRSLYRDRLYMLASFGEVMVFRSYPLFDPRGLVHVSQALRFINASRALSKAVPSSISMQHFLLAFAAYASGQVARGDLLVQELADLPETFGDEGSEGYLVAAFALMSLADPVKVEQGLALLDDCRHPHCQRTTSIGPYKMVGNAIAIAEAYAYLGQEAASRQALAAGEAWAKERYYPEPLQRQLAAVAEQLWHPELGLVHAWQERRSLGEIRWPMAPSQAHTACAMCHAGNEVPEHYYSWKVVD